MMRVFWDLGKKTAPEIDQELSQLRRDAREKRCFCRWCIRRYLRERILISRQKRKQAIENGK